MYVGFTVLKEKFDAMTQSEPSNHELPGKFWLAEFPELLDFTTPKN